MTKTQKLSVWEKAGYGFGDLASVLYWQTISAYLLYFYTDVFGITAAAAGTTLARLIACSTKTGLRLYMRVGDGK